MNLRFLSELRQIGIRRMELFRLVLFTILFASFEGFGIAFLLPVLEHVGGARGGTSLASQTARRILAHVPFRDAVPELALLLLLAFVPLTLRSVVQAIRDEEAAALKYRVTARIRKRAWGAFVNASPRFHLSHDRGALFSALTTETDRAADAVATRMMFMASFALFFVFLSLLFFLAPRLAFGAIPAFVVVGWVFRRQSFASRRLSDRISAQNTVLGELINNGLSGLDRIRMRGAESEAERRLDDSIEQVSAGRLAIERKKTTVETAMHPVAVLVAFGIVYVAVAWLKMSLASLGLFVFILVRMIPQLTLMNALWALMHGSLGSFRRVDELIQEAERHREQTPGGLAFAGLSREVRFEKVTFAYPAARSGPGVLRDVSFTVPTRGLTAVVGRSGAGKTTSMLLLAGFYPPDSGRILVDGEPLERYDIRSLRRQMAFVPQEPFFFQGSIRYNLSFGIEPPPTDRQLEEVLGETGCLEFVHALPEGLDSGVGERGARLSQGQKQRLALAHALACGSSILILDEPTSALDAESEKAIQAVLEKWRERISIVVIAHRLSTIRTADRILVLDRGTIQDAGTHDELLARDTLYRALFETQVIA